MKKIIFALVFILAGAVVGSSDAYGQRYDEGEYHYADGNTGIIYKLYMKFNGYQVQVWIMNSQMTDWSPCTVTNSNDETITFTNSGYTYNVELNPYNEDAVVLYNADYTRNWKYYKKQ